MEITKNILILCSKMKAAGWVVIQKEDYIEAVNEWTFNEKMELFIPFNKKSKSFPIQLESFLLNLIKIDENFSTLAIVETLLAQSRNIKQKFSKTKNDWLLAEPNSKYNINEIPNIYIPKFSIFE